MKAIIKSSEPPLLTTYRTAQPTNTWDQFKRNDARKTEVQTQLKTDQGGLCAYCEIDLLERNTHGEADFRVEHFHPKSDTSTTHNWHLDWQNLLGCCHGGSRPDVNNATERFARGDYSCDIPEDNRNLDSIILNPLSIPAFPTLFSCERTSGEMSVHNTNCQSAGVSETQAQQTLDELQLNARRLTRFRSKLINDLNNRIQAMVRQGKSIGEAQAYLAQAILRQDAQGYWPAFFTSIRSYLGDAAEKQLISIGYRG